MARPEPPQTAPVSTGLAEEDPLAERLVAAEIGPDTRGAAALEAEGLTIREGPAGAGVAGEAFAFEDGLAAADAAAAGLPVPAREVEEPPADDLVLNAEEERYLRGNQPERALPEEEMARVDDWDDLTAADQENLPEDEQQG